MKSCTKGFTLYTMIEFFCNNLWLSVALGVLALFFLFQLGVVKIEYILRWKRYRDARSFAASRGKPLLVVGRPGNRLCIYGCGDVCLDIDDRVGRDCPEGGMVGDVRNIPFSDKHFGAVFCSHILEYLPEVDDGVRAAAEMQRVADRVFLCYTLECNFLWRWFAAEQCLWIFRSKNGVVFKKKPW